MHRSAFERPTDASIRPTLVRTSETDQRFSFVSARYVPATFCGRCCA